MEALIQGLIGLIVVIVGWNIKRLYDENDRTRKRIHRLENDYSAVLTWLRIKFPLIDKELKKPERNGE